MIAVPIPVVFLLLFLIRTCCAKDKAICSPSSCGNIPNISYPFRLATDPQHCGNNLYTLHCENNSTILYLYSGKYYVKGIDYRNYSIVLVDTGINQAKECFSFPRFSLSDNNFSRGDPYNLPRLQYWRQDGIPKFFGSLSVSGSVALLSCRNPVVNSSDYVDIRPCTNGTSYPSDTHFYAYNIGSAVYLEDGCSIKQFIMMSFGEYFYKNWSTIEFQKEVLNGFVLYWWHRVYCPRHCSIDDCKLNYNKQFQCFANEDIICGRFFGGIFKKYDFCVYQHSTKVIAIGQLIYSYLRGIITGSFDFILLQIGIVLGGKFICGSPFLVGILIYKWRRRHLSEYDIIEEFLKNNNNLMPIRYSYSNIKKITKNFKHKIGEGGFGSVYKGQLRSGRFVAIKMLGKSGSNGQDFVNEVATIGVVHHVNVVKLIGFCVEGSKCALVYEFMTNGSLEKYIFSTDGPVSFNGTKLLDISLGVARGIEYLHRGCVKQILHFDIKPHNILLDENFIPKLSDFGLSKLYNANQSIVSVTVVRGTMGYMAPELCFKNIGNVSYKADVYSFGMLLLEMACKTKIWKFTVAENSSQDYFPIWAHDQISKGSDIEIGCQSKEENLIVKKMMIAGLWCIQMHPDNRPSMKKVVEMLEGDLNNVHLPPKPHMYPEVTVSRDETGASSSMSTDVTESTSLMKSFDLEFGDLLNSKDQTRL